MAAAPPMNRFYVLLALLVALGIGVLFWLMNRSSGASVPIPAAVEAADTGFAGYVLGPDTAPVEIVEFADYQCPACQTFELLEFPYVRERLVQTGRVRFVYKDFPLDTIHPWARLAAHAAACANDQGKFWEMHEAIYRTQPDWSASRDAGSHFRRAFQGLGGDVGAYDECMGSLRYAGRIQAMAEQGARLGVNSTPTFLIAGRLYAGVQRYDRLRQLVDSLSATP